MPKQNPPTPPTPPRSNFILSKPNNYVPPTPPEARSPEETQTEQAFQPPPESPAAEPGLKVPTYLELQQLQMLDNLRKLSAETQMRKQSQQRAQTPPQENHRRHPKFNYLVKICGSVETADRLARFQGVETAIFKLHRDRH